MHPFTYPFSRRSGTGMLSIESEDNSGVLNHYYAMRNRKYSWDNPGYFLLTDCVNANSVFAFHVDIRVHSAAKRTFRLQLTVHKADGSKSWPWLAVCAPQDINDGWVTCSGEYEFDGDEGTATKVEFYPVSDDSWYDDVDFDNFSMSFKSGPVTDLIVQDATGDLASCWGPGSELLVTSKSLNFDDVDTPVIQAVNHDPTTGTTRLALETPIGITSFADNEPKYGGVEVALLSRNVVFTSDSTAKVGGHLMILHTPNVVQTISGISLVKFGQQGNLGRYVSAFIVFNVILPFALPPVAHIFGHLLKLWLLTNLTAGALSHVSIGCWVRCLQECCKAITSTMLRHTWHQRFDGRF